MSTIAEDSSSVPRFLLVDSSGRQYALLTDGTTTASVDVLSSGLKIISIPHGRIHTGEYFTLAQMFLDLADSGNAYLRLTVGANKALHATITVTSEANAHLSLYEGPTFSAEGTTVTIYDKNRTTANTSDATAKHTPTVSTFGTKIHTSFLPGGTKKEAVGSARANGQEWIFKKSTEYLVRIINRGGVDKDFSVEIEFYEVD